MRLIILFLLTLSIINTAIAETYIQTIPVVGMYYGSGPAYQRQHSSKYITCDKQTATATADDGKVFCRRVDTYTTTSNVWTDLTAELICMCTDSNWNIIPNCKTPDTICVEHGINYNGCLDSKYYECNGCVLTSRGETIESYYDACMDGNDNDCDGKIDCYGLGTTEKDPDCTAAICTNPPEYATRLYQNGKYCTTRGNQCIKNEDCCTGYCLNNRCNAQCSIDNIIINNEKKCTLNECGCSLHYIKEKLPEPVCSQLKTSMTDNREHSTLIKYLQNEYETHINYLNNNDDYYGRKYKYDWKIAYYEILYEEYTFDAKIISSNLGLTNDQILENLLAQDTIKLQFPCETEDTIKKCTDKVDNDCDDKIDCEDSVCATMLDCGTQSTV